MSTSATTLQLKGLGKQRMAEVARRAKHLGMTPEDYLKHLLEEDLAISRAARTKTFAELMGPGREVDEQEVDRLVEAAKVKHHRRSFRKR